MLRLLPIGLCALALLVASCQRHGYVVPGEATLPAVPPIRALDVDPREDTPPLAHPPASFRVTPLEAIRTRGRLGRVRIHGPGPRPDLRRLELALEPDGVLEIVYRPPGGYMLPVAVGDPIAVRYLPPEAEGEFRGPALVLWTRDGELLAAVADGGGLPRKSLGDEVDLAPSRRLVYTEVRRLPSLCLAMIGHYRLRIQEDGEFRYAPPGTEASIHLRGRPYRVVALDVSRPADEACSRELHGELSFAVLALEEEISSPPEGEVQPPALK